jgi:hypothetical protein
MCPSFQQAINGEESEGWRGLMKNTIYIKYLRLSRPEPEQIISHRIQPYPVVPAHF